jgi:hypothetical protein
MHGTHKEIEQFDNYLESLTHIKYKVVIAGNHDICFDSAFKNKDYIDYSKSLLKNCIYLQDESVNLFGYKIYGSPW